MWPEVKLLYHLLDLVTEGCQLWHHNLLIVSNGHISLREAYLIFHSVVKRQLPFPI